MKAHEYVKTFDEKFEALKEQNKLPYKVGSLVTFSYNSFLIFGALHSIKLNKHYIIEEIIRGHKAKNSVKYLLKIKDDNGEYNYYHPLWIDKVYPPTEASKILYTTD